MLSVASFYFPVLVSIPACIATPLTLRFLFCKFSSRIRFQILQWLIGATNECVCHLIPWSTPQLLNLLWDPVALRLLSLMFSLSSLIGFPSALPFAHWFEATSCSRFLYFYYSTLPLSCMPECYPFSSEGIIPSKLNKSWSTQIWFQ